MLLVTAESQVVITDSNIDKKGLTHHFVNVNRDRFIMTALHLVITDSQFNIKFAILGTAVSQVIKSSVFFITNLH